ncbi:MAG: YccF domain-containing protein [Bacteroidaceae bacterium]|nr:YccF domain-containing protein [Bacteroidaceae bacterium]
MKYLGNILWLVLGGLIVAILYYLIGILFCITIIGIPFGLQLIKFGSFCLWPFGSKVVDGKNSSSCLSVVFNVIWIVTGWWEIAAAHAIFGLICCLTIVGIPFGRQHFKMAWLSLLPFGKKIV